MSERLLLMKREYVMHIHYIIYIDSRYKYDNNIMLEVLLSLLIYIFVKHEKRQTLD